MATDEADEPVDPGDLDGAGADRVDPALSYPRGNRLGLRTPRPTVVVVIVLIVLVGSAVAWRMIQPGDAMFCELTGSLGGQASSTEQEAFDAWWDRGGGTGVRSMVEARLGRPVDEPTQDDFERSGSTWTWRVDDAGVQVAVGPAVDSEGYRIAGVNNCDFVPADQV